MYLNHGNDPHRRAARGRRSGAVAPGLLWWRPASAPVPYDITGPLLVAPGLRARIGIVAAACHSRESGNPVPHRR